MTKLQSATPPPEDLIPWLAEWEKLLENGAFDQGLLSVLPRLEQFRLNFAVSLTRPSKEVRQLMERALRCYVSFIARASRTLVKEKYLDICRVKPTLGALTETVGAQGLSAPQLWKAFAKPSENEKLDLIQALGLVTLSNIHQFPGEKLTQLSPDLVAPLAYACLTQQNVVTKAQSDNQKWLLSNHDFYRQSELPDSAQTCAATAWMYCSYAQWEEKHKLKAAINDRIIAWSQKRKLFPAPSNRDRLKKTRPTVLIFAEVFSENHAMFRCHGQSAVALKDSFYTVLLADLKRVSPATRKRFSKTVQLDQSGKRVEKTLKLIQKIKPDMIYYPSIGMTSTTVFLSNMRLAPIQFMSMGHPASSFSPEMDYVVMNNDLRPAPGCFSEKIIHRRQSAGYVRSSEWSPDLLKGRTQLDPSFRHVAVLGFMPKNTHQFIEVCRRLDEETDTPIKFHFFPNSISSEFFGFRAAISRQFKTAAVYPRASYEGYMNLLQAMDLVLSTFPFGNTNGTVDTLLAGVPMIALEGPEPHAKTDARLLRKVGAPDDMLVSSVGAYYRTAKAWLSDPALLAAKRAEIAALDVEGTFYSPSEDSDFDEVVHLIYEVHEKLQADSRREFEFDDLVTLQQTDAAAQQA